MRAEAGQILLHMPLSLQPPRNVCISLERRVPYRDVFMLVQRQKGKERGKGREPGGGNTAAAAVGVSFDGANHRNICIYSNRGADEKPCARGGEQRRANRRAASPLRGPEQPPVSQQHPGRDTGKWCGNREAPRAERGGGGPHL
ncbi:hypothetical protein EYF80_050436 [Liparis tanakae]|uniref:Uncharacterized protein n=1 Tax=Liparis tanakae TaxID=230148 RepID=A0A4Z2FEU8_9TELE|nr:hypothetical protein EYF80_050436 [Liparis tanakae]